MSFACQLSEVIEGVGRLFLLRHIFVTSFITNLHSCQHMHLCAAEALGKCQLYMAHSFAFVALKCEPPTPTPIQLGWVSWARSTVWLLECWAAEFAESADDLNSWWIHIRRWKYMYIFVYVWQKCVSLAWCATNSYFLLDTCIYSLNK